VRHCHPRRLLGAAVRLFGNGYRAWEAIESGRAVPGQPSAGAANQDRLRAHNK
jgi:hypothetical protein